MNKYLVCKQAVFREILCRDIEGLEIVKVLTEFIATTYGNSTQEMLFVCVIKNLDIYINNVAIGSYDNAKIDFTSLMELPCIIDHDQLYLLHNHQVDLPPSMEDLNITKKGVSDIHKLIGKQLNGHIVCGLTKTWLINPDLEIEEYDFGVSTF